MNEDSYEVEIVINEQTGRIELKLENSNGKKHNLLFSEELEGALYSILCAKYSMNQVASESGMGLMGHTNHPRYQDISSEDDF